MDSTDITAVSDHADLSVYVSLAETISASRLRLLHELSTGGPATVARLADRTETSEDEVQSDLVALGCAGFVSRHRCDGDALGATVFRIEPQRVVRAFQLDLERCGVSGIRLAR